MSTAPVIDRRTTLPLNDYSPITVHVTDTVVRSYNLTTSQLEDLGLPTSMEGLVAMDSDEIGSALLEGADEDNYAVTDRDIEITSTP